MGTMEKLRQGMPALFVLLAITFVILIIFEWGNARSGGGGGGNQASERYAGMVNGEKITWEEFNDRVEKVKKAQRENKQNTGTIDDDQIRESVWNQMVEEILLRQEAAKLGIEVSDDQLRDALLYDPPAALKQQFTDSTGVFLEAMYLQFMTNPDKFFSERRIPQTEVKRIKESLLEFQESYRQELLRQGIESAIGATAVPSSSSARVTYNEQKTKVSGSFVFLDANTIADSVTVSDKEAQAYYDAHKDDYHQKASREIKYVSFPLAPNGQDSSAMTRRLQDLLKALALSTDKKDSVFSAFANRYGDGDFKGVSFTPLQEVPPELQKYMDTAQPGTILGPLMTAQGTQIVDVIAVQDTGGEEYIKAQHILIKTGPGVKDDSAKAVAAKALQEVKAGKAFEIAAAQYSADGSAQRGGDLGYFKHGNMVKEFDSAAFTLSKGQLSGLVKTQFGYHIIKVNDRTRKQVKLRDIKFSIKPGSNAKNLLRRSAQEFHDKLKAGNKPIDSLATEMKLQAITSGPIPNASTPISGSGRLTNFLFQGNVGDVSDVIELKDGGAIVGQIVKIRKEGIAPFEEVKDRIIAELQKSKKVAMLEAKIKSMRAVLTDGDSLSKVRTVDTSAKVQSFTDLAPSAPLPLIGFDYPLNAAIFYTIKPGTISNPIKGKNGYYIATVTTRTEPSDADYKKEETDFMKQQISQKRSTLFQQWLQKLKQKADIQDNRYER